MLQLKKITSWQLPFRTSFAWREHADFTSWIFQFLNKVNIGAIEINKYATMANECPLNIMQLPK